MNIIIKTDKEIALMRVSGKILGQILLSLKDIIEDGITTSDIEIFIRKQLKRNKVKSPFLGYHGYPAASCISVNEEIVHGIPSNKKLCEGDIVSVDLGVIYKGFITDAARTFPVGNIDKAAENLISKTKESFINGAKMAVQGNHLYDISYAIQNTIEKAGLFLVRDFVSHGTGKKLHEDPSFTNFGTQGTGPVLKKGMTLAIEPMVTIGDFNVKIRDDGWTAVTADNSLSAHYENTVLILENTFEILTEI